MSNIIALVGNQNSGKTTLFNALTGSNQHVGNFPGVTVEKKEGVIKRHSDLVLVDLPGIYSLSPYSSEEIVTRDFIVKERPKVIINIVDATNIERNLYLTLQVMELGIPMVIALNMMDEVLSSGNSIDVMKLSALLGVPVVPISAIKKSGIEDLLDMVIKTLNKPISSLKVDFCSGPVHKAIHSVSYMIEDNVKGTGYPSRFVATKLIEGDKVLEEELNLSDDQKSILFHTIEAMEHELGIDREAAMADMRYTFIESICKEAVIRHQQTNEQLRSEKIDKVLTHKYLGLPIFLIIMFMIFWLTFSVIGVPLQSALSDLISLLTHQLDVALTHLGVSFWLHSLLQDGIAVGVGSVLSFFPIIVILFFFLSLLEDSGYMARVAFVMDKLLRKIGLSGRSFVPMLIGFGCSVPAIMATRTLPGERDRKLTIVITPFMSCSAKLPIYAMITLAFFPDNAALVMISIYMIGMITAVLSGLLLKKTIFKGEPIPFVMELPAYRMPAAKNVVMHMWEKGKDFIQRAFSIILLSSLVVWFLQSCDFRLNFVNDSSLSILAAIGSVIAPIFKPLGFNDWRISTALITGVLSKESVVSTLSVLTGAHTDIQLSNTISSLLSPLSAYSFLVFCVLYIPCIAAFAAMRREFGSMKSALATVTYQTAVAYIMAFLVYNIGSLFI